MAQDQMWSVAGPRARPARNTRLQDWPLLQMPRGP